MAIEKTISLRHTVDGLAQDLTTCEFASPPAVSPAFGVRRADTLEVIVASGQDFDHDDTGEYSYDLTGLVEGVSYSYYIHTVYEGIDRWHLRTFEAEAGFAAGLYADESDLDDLRGSDAITSWSDLTAANIRDHDRIQKAFNNADMKIQKELDRVYSFPLTGLSGADLELLREWSRVIAADWLYKSRGQRDGITPMGTVVNLFAGDMKEVMDDIWRYANNIRFLGSSKIDGATTRVVVNRNYGRPRRCRIQDYAVAVEDNGILIY